MRRTTAATLATAAFVAPTAAGAVPAVAAPAATATVSVLHGVPGLTADVYANGQELIPGFVPGALTEPQQLPAGSYDLAVFPTGADPTGTPAFKADDVEVPAGANITVVAHLDEDGTPVLTPFVNDASPVADGEARLSVRHVAAAPAADVRAGGTVVVPGLVNAQEASLEVPAGTTSADLTAAGSSERLVGPADLDLAPGSSTAVYAYGSLLDGTLALAVQEVSDQGQGLQVHGGSGGLADGGAPGWVFGTAALGLLGAGVAATRIARARA